VASLVVSTGPAAILWSAAAIAIHNYHRNRDLEVYYQEAFAGLRSFQALLAQPGITPEGATKMTEDCAQMVFGRQAPRFARGESPDELRAAALREHFHRLS
jgi:hypothetical protein